MDLSAISPVIIYDDRCLWCSRFARMANAAAGHGLSMIGHYSETGKEMRAELLGEDALEMFWFIDGRTAYGGRAALWPLIRTMLRPHKTRPQRRAVESCASECSGVRAVLLRSASLITHSRRIELDSV